MPAATRSRKSTSDPLARIKFSSVASATRGLKRLNLSSLELVEALVDVVPARLFDRHERSELRFVAGEPLEIHRAARHRGLEIATPVRHRRALRRIGGVLRRLFRVCQLLLPSGEFVLLFDASCAPIVETAQQRVGPLLLKLQAAHGELHAPSLLGERETCAGRIKRTAREHLTVVETIYAGAPSVSFWFSSQFGQSPRILVDKSRD